MKTPSLLLSSMLVLTSCGLTSVNPPAATSTGTVQTGSVMTGMTMTGTTMSGMSLHGHDMDDMRVTSEAQFLVDMTAHHQEAVDSAKALLAMGPSKPQVRALLGSIITSQEAEIRTMGQWHVLWYGDVLPVSTTYKPMMRSLSGVSPRNAEKQFVEDMIVHHEGAVAMARDVQMLTQRPELRALADAIITAQTREIEDMRSWLAAW